MGAWLRRLLCRMGWHRWHRVDYFQGSATRMIYCEYFTCLECGARGYADHLFGAGRIVMTDDNKREWP